MATTKRKYEEMDPDYADVGEQQIKRQRELEQDAKQTVCRRIQAIVRNEFRKEINNKELELLQVDRRLNEARLMMDRLRACIISTYYGQINQSGSSEMSRMNGPPSSIHPCVKKYLGKRPSHHEASSDIPVSQSHSSSKSYVSLDDVSDSTSSLHHRSDSGREQQTRTLVTPPVHQSPLPAAACNTASFGIPSVLFADNTNYNDRHSRFKVKKKIIIGNVSKYIPVDHREANDKSSHKWMVYVRGPKSEPNISGFVKKVWFFLHHSYKPNDLVEISSPPFHLTRRGWGEFPVRVQLHFIDPRNKKVDIIHQLKLDKTFSGLQTLGAETTVELDLEKDFFVPDTSNTNISYMRPTPSCSPSFHQTKLQCISVSNTTILPSNLHLTGSQSDQSSAETESCELEADDAIDTHSVTDTKDIVVSQRHHTFSKHETCVMETSGMRQLSEIETSSCGQESNQQIMGEYNLTIAHDSENCEDHNHVEKNKVLDQDEAGRDSSETFTKDRSINSSTIYSACISTPTSLATVQPFSSCVTLTSETAMTIINKPHWMNSEKSCASGKPDMTVNFLPSARLAKLSSGTDSLKVLNTDDVVDNVSELLSVFSTQQSLKSSPSVMFKEQSSKTTPLTIISTTQSSKTIPLTIISTTQSSKTTPLTVISTTQSSKTNPLTIISKTQSSRITPLTIISTTQSSKTGPISIVSIPQNSKISVSSGKLNNFKLVDTNAQHIKSSSAAVNVKQACSSLPLSSSLIPLLVRPISSPTQTMIIPAVCSGQSSATTSLQQHVTVATSENITSSFEPCVVPLSQQVLPQVKESQASIHTSGAQKVIILKSNTSSVVSQGGNINTAGFESKSLLQPKPSGPRQVSLLTGKVFAPKTQPTHLTKMTPANHGSNNSLLGNNIKAVKSLSDKTLTPGKSANQITKCLTQQPGNKILLLKTVNCPSLSVSSTTVNKGSHINSSTNEIANINNFVVHGLTSLMDNESAVSVETVCENPLLPVSVVINPKPANNSLMQASHNNQIDMRNISVHVPNQEQTQHTISHNFSTYPKMSAIGITKLGKNVPTQGTMLRPTTDEERKKNQYEVLMTWKRNRLLNEKTKNNVRHPRDRIDGEIDIIPELTIEDYTSMAALMRSAVKLHPLIQSGVNKLTHPYCSESLAQWATWTVGKRLASEWHRACFVLKYLKSLLGAAGSFRGEELMTTRQLVHWCRLHAFSPIMAVTKVKSRNSDGSILEESNPSPSCGHIPYFTSTDNLDVKMLTESAAQETTFSRRENIDVVDVVAADMDFTKKLATRVPEPAADHMTLEWLPPTDETLFVYDQLRKRGIKLQPNELHSGVVSYTAADMIYTAMQEFLMDVLRETVAVSAVRTSQSSCVQITRRDVHAALTHLPEAAFSCNKFLGKSDAAGDVNGR